MASHRKSTIIDSLAVNHPEMDKLRKSEFDHRKRTGIFKGAFIATLIAKLVSSAVIGHWVYHKVIVPKPKPPIEQRLSPPKSSIVNKTQLVSAGTIKPVRKINSRGEYFAPPKYSAPLSTKYASKKKPFQFSTRRG